MIGSRKFQVDLARSVLEINCLLIEEVLQFFKDFIPIAEVKGAGIHWVELRCI
jgi:hypothetical protein